MENKNVEQILVNNYIPFEEDYAYIAGLIEGEGSIGINKIKQITRRDYRYCPTISISMREKECLEYLIKVFPQSLLTASDRYYVHYKSLKTQEIIPKIYPYLTFKKNLADILIEMFKIKELAANCQTKRTNEYETLKQKLIAGRISNKPLPQHIENSQITDIKLSYIAGLIDGEGSFGIYNMKNKTTARFSIMMTDWEGIAEISKMFGGNIKTYHYNQKYKRNYMLVYSSKLEDSTLYYFLDKIIPFLKLKKKQAEICMEFIEKNQSLSPLERQKYVELCKLEKNNKQIGEIIPREIVILNENKIKENNKSIEIYNEKQKEERKEYRDSEEYKIKKDLKKSKTIEKNNNQTLEKAKNALIKLINITAKYRLYPGFETLYNKNFKKYPVSLIWIRDFIQSFLTLNKLEWEEFQNIEIYKDSIILRGYEERIKNASPKWTVELNTPNNSEIKLNMKQILDKENWKFKVI